MKYLVKVIKSLIVLLLITTFSGNPVIAQELLPLDEAIQIGVENNFGLEIARNLLEQSENNQTLGNAGFLPLVSASASRNESIEDSEFNAGGESRTTEGARSTSENAAINAEWTVFDGLGMFRSYNRLGKLAELSDKDLQLSVENLIANITLAYFDIVRIEQQLRVLENNISVSEERIEIEETKVDLGSGSEYDLLQAMSDLNADRAAFIRETSFLTEAKIVLNQLLSRSPSSDFGVTMEIPVNRSLLFDELLQSVLSDNTDLAIAKIEENIRSLELEEIQSERFPEVTLSGGYNFNRTDNSGGFISFNESTGFSYGITARVTLFDGFNTNRRVQNAKINEKNARLNLEQQKLAIESEFTTLYRTYQNAVSLVDLEEDNFKNAEEVLDIALERFRLGSISSLEFREAQRTLLQAENRLITAKYESKIAETRLLRLSGDLGGVYVR
jgi:outer membrane protein TolC